jgi:hypothetical protein
MGHVGMFSAESYLNISHSRHPFKFLLQVEILHRLVLESIVLGLSQISIPQSNSGLLPYALPFHNHTRPCSRPRLCLFCPHRCSIHTFFVQPFFFALFIHRLTPMARPSPSPIRQRTSVRSRSAQNSQSSLLSYTAFAQLLLSSWPVGHLP